MTAEHELLDTIEDIRAKQFPELPADLVKQIVLIETDFTEKRQEAYKRFAAPIVGWYGIRPSFPMVRCFGGEQRLRHPTSRARGTQELPHPRRKNQRGRQLTMSSSFQVSMCRSHGGSSVGSGSMSRAGK